MSTDTTGVPSGQPDDDNDQATAEHPVNTSPEPDFLDDARDQAARITDDDIEARLRRSLRRAGYSAPAPASPPREAARTHDDETARADLARILGPDLRQISGALPGPAAPWQPPHAAQAETRAAQRNAEQLISAARTQASRARAEAAALLEAARRDRAEAAELLKAARREHDHAISGAAQITRDARDRAEAEAAELLKAAHRDRAEAAELLKAARRDRAEAAELPEAARSGIRIRDLTGSGPGSTWLASHDRDVRIWDAATGQQRTVLPGQAPAPADGGRILAGPGPAGTITGYGDPITEFAPAAASILARLNTAWDDARGRGPIVLVDGYAWHGTPPDAWDDGRSGGAVLLVDGSLEAPHIVVRISFQEQPTAGPPTEAAAGWRRPGPDTRAARALVTAREAAFRQARRQPAAALLTLAADRGDRWLLDALLDDALQAAGRLHGLHDLYDLGYDLVVPDTAPALLAARASASPATTAAIAVLRRHAALAATALSTGDGPLAAAVLQALQTLAERVR